MYSGENKNTSVAALFCIQWRIWLRYYAISRKVAGSFSDVSFAFFIDLMLPGELLPWGRPMPEMSILAKSPAE
jgi:hypothetical protein